MGYGRAAICGLGGKVSEKRYVIMELEDAKALASNASAGFDDRVQRVIDRIEAETGADIEDIVAQLKGIEPCHACVVESQERYCVCWGANKLGRRLSRLVDRANVEGNDAPQYAG